MGHIAAKPEILGLQKRLDKNPIGAPANQYLFDILEELFTEEECRIATNMPLKLASARKIAELAAMDPKRVEQILGDMSEKGLTVDIPAPSGNTYFALNPLMIGFFEFTMMRVRKDIDQKKVAKLMWGYLKEDPQLSFLTMVSSGDTFLARPAVHEDMLEPEVYSEVLDYEKATWIIENTDAWSEGICHCRHVKFHKDQPCEKPMEMCLSLGFGAKYLIRHDMAKAIQKERALEILEKAHELNMVQMVDNVKKNPFFMCNCCKCCCEMMEGFRTIPKADHHIRSNYLAVVDEEACNGCGKCMKACPVEIIGLYPAKPTPKAEKRKRKAKVNEAYCLGCGVCARQCKFDSMKMKPIKTKVYTPETLMEKNMIIALEQGKLQNLLFDDRDKLSHRTLSSMMSTILNLSPARKLLATQQLKSKFVQRMLSAFERSKDGWMAKI